jgi:hypothetical protein
MFTSKLEGGGFFSFEKKYLGKVNSKKFYLDKNYKSIKIINILKL